MEIRIALIPGDGIGPEVLAEARRVLESVARSGLAKLSMESFPNGADHFLATGETLSEAELYKTGKQAFDEGRYDVAREKFKELLSKYPKSENADNAQFWVGEIYYREKYYAEAIMEYQKVIENYVAS